MFFFEHFSQLRDIDELWGKLHQNHSGYIEKKELNNKGKPTKTN